MALNNFDMELKSLFYPLIMFIETAIKNYVLEAVLEEGQSEHFHTIFATILTDYKYYSKGSDDYKKAYKKRLNLQNKIYGVLTRDYSADKPIVQHFYHKDANVPIWAIFEVISLGEFGTFVACLNQSTRKKISTSLGFHQGYDSAGRLTAKIIYTIKDLRNSVAHNDVIFDTRFKRSNVGKHLKDCLTNATGIGNITFDTIVDYLILLVYLLRNLGVSRTETKKHITEFERIVETSRRTIPYPIFLQ